MCAIKLHATGDIRTVDVDVPSPAKNEILIKVEAAGICGTDRYIYHGKFPSVPDKILGHEFSGIVVESGKEDIAEGIINVSSVVSGIISVEEVALAIASPPPKGEVRAIVVPNHD